MLKTNFQKKHIFSVLMIFFLLFLPLVIFAQNKATEDESTYAQQGLKGAAGMLQIVGKPAGFAQQPKSLEEAIGVIVSGVLVLIGVIFGLLVVYGGYLWLIARGNEKFVEKAKDTLEAAIIGLLIVMGAYAITSFILSYVIQAGGFVPQ